MYRPTTESLMLMCERDDHSIDASNTNMSSAAYLRLCGQTLSRMTENAEQTCGGKGILTLEETHGDAQRRSNNNGYRMPMVLIDGVY